jgi:hypothetical protein
MVGQGLVWLAANGFPIPPTWVLGTSAFDLVLSRTGADRDVAEMRWSLTGLWDDLAAVDRVLAALEDQRISVARSLRSAPLPDVLGQSLEQVAPNDTLWMLRASLAFEDRDAQVTEFSLSGVKGGAGLWDGIRQVWASVFRREVLEHCAQTDIPLPGVAVALHPLGAITVQDRSGVVFSSSPWPGVTGPVVRAVAGGPQHAKGRVYGRACGQWVPLKRQSESPQWAMITSENGGMGLQPYPEGIEPLTDEQAQRLVSLAEAVAEKWNGPVKVTFFWPFGSEPVLLQRHALE